MESLFLKRFTLNIEKFSDDIFIHESETERKFTYGKFSKDCYRACYFLNTKYSDSEIIVIQGHNSYLYSVYALAVVLSGKTLCPLNPDEDPTILKSILSKLDRKYSVLSENNFALLSSISIPENYSPPGPEKNQDLIYISTSATTGEPKIVIQKEVAILANVDDLIAHHKMIERKKIATPLPLFHVNAFHFSFLSTLFSGGQLFLFRYFDPRKCFELIEKEKIEILSIIPTLLTNIIRNHDILKVIDISSLKYFVSAAAPLSVETVRDVWQLFRKKIIQGYGLSETINFSSTLPIDIDETTYENVMCNERFPSVGVSLKSNEIVIFSDDSNVAKSGEEGELGIKGINLMSGYLNTSMDHFYHGDFFLTGDLGFYKVYNGKKYFYISGRKKEIAKISGETVSLREIDELLRLHTDVEDDFFSVAFDNQYKGEEIGMVCKLKVNENAPLVANRFITQFKKIKNNRRPKVILFVRELDIRTPSGKAKRFFFKEYFGDFSEKRLLNQTFIKII